MRRLVPGFIVEKYRANETSGFFQAAAIFVDISGFSKLTDTLAKHGQHGAEVLATLMRVIFRAAGQQGVCAWRFCSGICRGCVQCLFPSDQVQVRK
jgi:hypothetical protein